MTNKNFFIPILTIALILGGAGTTQVFAHIDPDPQGSPGVAASIPVYEHGTTNEVLQAENGDVVDVVLILSKANPTGPALDGGTIDITTPDGTTQTNSPGTVPVECVGGTTNTGDLVGAADCGAALASFVSEIVEYTVSCDDAVDTDEDSATPKVIVFTGEWTGSSHRNVGDTLGASATPQNEIECIEQYTVSTSSSDTGVIDGTVSDPTDDVTISGVNGVEGTFETDAVLSGPGGPYAATCSPSPETTDTFDLIVTCSLDAPTDLTTPGQYCWDVTVEETGFNYGTDGDGEYLGSDDANNECFTISDQYTVSTSSSITGDTEAPVSDPTDDVTISGVNGVEGTFETDAVLSGPGGPYAATCLPSPETTSSFDLIVTCSLDAAPIELTEPGQYCWDVTVEETGSNYGIIGDGEYLGSDDANNECFTITEDLVTRTPGYWKTHYTQAAQYWPGFECPGPSFQVNTVQKYMGGMWASQTRETDNDKRSDLDHARMMLAFQLMPAILNNEAFGSDPGSFGTTIPQGITAFCGNNKAAMMDAHGDFSAFNVSGDLLPFPPGFTNTAATTAIAKSNANVGFWDQPNLPG